MGSGRDRALMVVLIVVVAVLAVLSTPSEETNEGDVRPSTFRTTAHGANALFLTLEEVGVPVERRLAPYVDAEPLEGPLALLAPVEPPTPEEVEALLRWVEEGGTLLYAAGPWDGPLLEALGLDVLPLAPDSLSAFERASWEGRTATPAPHALSAGTPPVEGFRWAFDDTSPAFEGPLEVLSSTSAGDAVVVSYPRGEGRVVAWSDPAPLTNRALRESGGAVLFARAAAAAVPEEGALVFDEYHHGYRGDGSVVGAVWRFLREAPAGHAALQLGVAGMLTLLFLGWRFGAPYPPPPARRRSPLEHVEALAGAYRQAGARATARRLLLAGMARRLGRRGPHDAREEEELLERLETRLPVGREAARGVREEWSRGEKADLAALSRTIDRLLAEVKRP